MISAAFPYEKQRKQVLGRTMAYVEVGVGDPIVFLLGNPISSYVWRNMIPYLQGLGRCIAPDLIGMGDSEKLPDSGHGSYIFVEHRRYLDALFEALQLTGHVTLILHDWGSALGFDWANRHRTAVKGIVYMEAIVLPRSFQDWPEPIQQVFRELRSAAGDSMILDHNYFVEAMLPRGLSRQLTYEEMEHYRRPFAEPGEGRRPTLRKMLLMRLDRLSLPGCTRWSSINSSKSKQKPMHDVEGKHETDRFRCNRENRPPGH